MFMYVIILCTQNISFETMDLYRHYHIYTYSIYTPYINKKSLSCFSFTSYVTATICPPLWLHYTLKHQITLMV